MGTNTEAYFKRVLAELKRFGLLLESDSQLPSVCSLIAGEPLRGSWWSHPKAHAIFAVNEQLNDHKDVLITKLISGKVTFVYRQLWPELLALGTARADWQTKGLSPGARALLETVDADGELRTDQLPLLQSGKPKPGDSARELEKKLLVVARQFHTESGAHAKMLETWQHWAERIVFSPKTVPVEHAIKSLQDRLIKLNQQFGANAKLPWS